MPQWKVLGFMKRPRRRLAVLSTTISRSVDSFYSEIIDELRDREFEVHVVTSPGPELARLGERSDVLHVINMKREVSPFQDIKALGSWIRLLAILRPQLVFAGTPKASLLGMTAAKLTGVPTRTYFLQGLRLEGVDDRSRRLLAGIERMTSWCSTGVIAVSPSLASRFKKLGLNFGTAVSVPGSGSSHGVDSSFFSPRERDIGLMLDLGLDPAVPVVLFVGRLTADKGPAMLSKAMTLLESAHRAQLVVVGAQDEHDSTSYVRDFERGLFKVCVIPHLEDVRPYYAMADVLALPTKREGMPNVVLEAAAMGKPSVTTAVTGAVDSVIPNVTGILVPWDDGNALAAALERVLVDTELRAKMGRAARARVIRDFDPGDVARAICDVALASNEA